MGKSFAALSIVAIAVASASPVQAQLLYGEYVSDEPNPIYSTVVGTALQTYERSNDVLISRGQTPLYCKPAEIELTRWDVDALIRVSAISAGENVRSTPVISLVLKALVDRYPC